MEGSPHRENIVQNCGDWEMVWAEGKGVCERENEKIINESKK